MASSVESRSTGIVQGNPLVVAIVAYAIVCVPAYLWLEGPVGGAGTVDGSVAAIALALGAIMFVPIIKAGIENRTSRLGPRREGGYEDDRGAEGAFEHATERSEEEETDPEVRDG